MFKLFSKIASEWQHMKTTDKVGFIVFMVVVIAVPILAGLIVIVRYLINTI